MNFGARMGREAHKFVHLIGLGCMAFAEHAVSAETEVQIHFRKTAVVSAKHIRLEDIATVKGLDQESVSELTKLEIGPSPRYGHSEVIPAASLRQLLRKKLTGYRVELTGAHSVHIDRAEQRIEAREAVDAATRYLYGLLEKDSISVNLKPLGQTPMVNLSAGQVTWRVRNSAIAPTATKRMVVLVDAFVEDELQKSISIPFEVEAFRTVLTVRRDLEKGEMPQCKDVEEKVVNIADLEPAVKPIECAGHAWRLRRRLNRGSVILNSDVEAMPDVAQGDVVNLKVKNGAVQLETTAMSLNDGFVGQVIPVRASGSKETISARIVGPGIVEAVTR